MARRHARMVGAPRAVMESAKRHHASKILSELQPGDIFTRTFDDQKATTWYDKLSPVKKLKAAINNIPSTALAGKGAHSAIYVGRGKVIHYYPPDRGGYQIRNIADDITGGSYFTRPALSKKERSAAAQRAREFLASNPETPRYGIGRSLQAGLNKVLPIGDLCSNSGDRQLCSSFVADMYGGKINPVGTPTHLVTPTDLAGLPGAHVRKVR